MDSMDIPPVSEFRSMTVEEIEQKVRECYDPNREYTLEEQKVWYEIFGIRLNKLDVERPDLFDVGASVAIEYVVGDEDILPYTSVGGDIVSEKHGELVVESREVPEKYYIDLDDLTVEVELLVDEEEADHEISSPGDLRKIQLSAPPWDSHHDGVAAGLSMSMLTTEYSWVSEGVYMYPPDEFFETDVADHAN